MVNRPIWLALVGLLLVIVLAGCQRAESELLKTETDPTSLAVSESRSSLAVDLTDGSLLKADDSLFRSIDQGQSWQELPLGDSVDSGKVSQVATSLAVPSSVFAAGPGAGIVRSDDGGQTWDAISDSLPSQQVTAFALHSSKPDIFYAWVSGHGVFRTKDGGAEWEKMDDGPPAPVVALAHSTLDGSMNTGWLYAATPEGVYLSMDCF